MTDAKRPAGMGDRPIPKCLDSETIASLRELAATDAGLLGDLVDTFLADSPPRLDAMEQAASGKDCAALARAAHGLKSSAGNMGARILAELCNEVERSARSGALDGAAPLVARARREFDTAAKALAELRG